MSTLEKIEEAYQACLQNTKWNKASIREVLADENFKYALKEHFQSKKLVPYSDEWVSYNWCMGTAFGVGINMLNALK